MSPNFLVTGLAALIPLLIGSIWYNPKVLGNAWIKTTGLSEEELKKANMAKIFGFTLLFSFLMAMALNAIVIHQFGFFSILMNEPGLTDPNSEIGKYAADFMARHGNNFRTFKHGAFHGTISAIFFAMPVLGINALFERKSFKYIMIHTGYWIITLALMGGVICQFT